MSPWQRAIGKNAKGLRINPSLKAGTYRGLRLNPRSQLPSLILCPLDGMKFDRKSKMQKRLGNGGSALKEFAASDRVPHIREPAADGGMNITLSRPMLRPG